MKKHILLLPIFSLTACFSNPSGLTEKFFEGKKWTEWRTEDDTIKISVTGSYFGKYQNGIGSVKGAPDKYYYARFIFNVQGSSDWDYLLFYKMDGRYSTDFKFDLKAVKKENIIENDKIKILSSKGEEYILIGHQIDKTNIDLRKVANAKLRSRDNNIEFNYLYDSESLQKGAIYYAQYNDKRIKLIFDDNFRFTITESWEIKCSGSYFATRETVKLSFETNELFEFKTSIDFDLLFDNKIDS